MINAIIIDDEQHCINRLNNLLATHYHNSIAVVSTADSVPEAYKLITHQQPHLVFLDVQIHDKTGFDLLRELGKINFEIIFTTAYDKFAVEAFKFSALDYLLKPVDADDLKLAIDKFKDRTHNQQPGTKQIDVLLSNTGSQSDADKRIIIPTVNGFEVFKITDISRCESNINYTTIYLKDKQKLLVAKTLKEFEEMLTGYNFFRLHNSHLVNLGYIKSYHKGKGGSVILIDGTEIDVSTRRKEDFLKKMADI